MAQKAAKSQAARNSATLNRTHLISLAIYTLFFLTHTLHFPRSLPKFITLTLPSLIIELLLERTGRPSYTPTGVAHPGADLEAKGLTEWMWDVLYWTWGVVVLVIVAGDWAWWFYVVVPVYTAYLGFAAYKGVRKGFGDLTGGAEGRSKRQMKMERRGGQKVVRT
ncbi:hypothetical protein K470DRAFT_272797 [Piedraia hortae CBS 480.64]|uniref:DUF788-domain-containing protein n=1 Tax=Piedraia hortae CBS 480.64 TaxID=1314780 RepID=A0A6A7BS01_9PEZI|nr:hypothetical protein K470DRAFT_272797 [Piedraia hortae CBS 480.64]